MKVVIIEDESGVAKNLCDLLMEIEEDIEILATLESVRDTVYWLENNPSPDLGFFDIRLADGDSFEIFEKTTVDFPVVFTTAYDEYALRAFKVNSIDYLLKPIDKVELTASVNKFRDIYGQNGPLYKEMLRNALKELKIRGTKNYKRNFLVYIKDQILPVPVEAIAYFLLENSIVYCITLQNERYIIDQSLDSLITQLNPEQFFRANRQYIVSRRSLISANQYFNRKLKLSLSPSPPGDVIISKPKSSEFKKWLERG